MRKSRLGAHLFRNEIINKSQLDELNKLMALHGDTFISTILKLEILSSDELYDFISRISHKERIDLNDIPALVAIHETRMDLSVLKKLIAIPIHKKDKTITMAISDPFDMSSLDELSFSSGCQLSILIATEEQILERLNDSATEEDNITNVMSDLGIDSLEIVDTDEKEKSNDQLSMISSSEDAPVVKLVNMIMMEAMNRGASDIHVEPYEKILRIRMRVDGMLQEIIRPPLSMKEAVVSRLKIMAKLDISERRAPQDGRIKMKVSETKSIDFRVSVLPTLFGEKVVMRILDSSNLQLDMTKLGYEPGPLKKFQEAINNPYGMVLVTGPTGSGKTVSLYSAVAEINKEDVNISTAEDPVEFNFMGINQVNVNPAVGMDFPAALKSFLRQDPDIILIGEIRDYETGAIGVKAALTGHLVLATLHTNDAPSTITRMINMGIESFLVGSAISLITAQRLGRRICSGCKEHMEVPERVLLEAGFKEEHLEEAMKNISKGHGCKLCNGTGYKGRVGIYQVMPIYEEIKDAIFAGANSDEIAKISIRLGVDTLRMAALNKVRFGEMSLEECLRITIGD